MVNFIYNILIILVSCGLKLVGLFNKKIEKGVVGRNKSFKILERNIPKNDKIIWFHCASLGEYEQGLPVFEEVKKQYPKHKIVLSFFSPSGYEIRKNSPIADVVIYLPLDTKQNAKKLITFLKPELSIFVKYDIWPNYMQELKKHQFDSILISAAFRPNQIYFKWYGSLFRNALLSFNHIFTQNKISLGLLRNINYNNCTHSGDTRFDRVTNQLSMDNTVDFIESFKDGKTLIVFGSSWEADEKLYLDFINNSSNDIKFLIAPHEINDEKINALSRKINKEQVLFSKMKQQDLKSASVFILNTIGLLSKAYSYADIAYVGGAAGKTGLHNILEPATFGVPILFGKNHEKFPEAKALVEAKGAFDIYSNLDFEEKLTTILKNYNVLENMGQNAKMFISSKTGATKQIVTYIDKNKKV